MTLGGINMTWLRRWSFITIPLILLIAFLFYCCHFHIVFSESTISSIVNISGVLIGFLFTMQTLLFTFPQENKFIQRLKEFEYFKIIIKNIISGEIFLLIALVIGLFGFESKLCISSFILGLSNVLVTGYYMGRISIYVSK